MKIAFLGIKTFPPEYGGMETMTSAIVESLISDPNISVTVFPLHSSTSLVSHDNLAVLPLRVKNIPYLRSILGGIVGVIKAFKLKPDVVHLNGLENAYLLPLFRALGLKVVLNIRGTKWTVSKWDDNWFKISNLPIFAGMLFFLINMKYFASWANRIVTVNDVALEQMPASARKKAEVIYNSLDIHLKEDKNILELHHLAAGNYLMFIGRIVPLKGLHYLIQAYSKLKLSSFPLVIVGHIDENNSYHAYLKHLATGSDVRFIGAYYGNASYNLIKNANLLILPSETEGMAVTILESALLETPILVSDIPENTKLWGDSIFYFANKSVTDLMGHLARLMMDRQFCQSKIKIASNIANNKFNHITQMENMLKIYKDLAS